jgi:hypothetical protein
MPRRRLIIKCLTKLPRYLHSKGIEAPLDDLVDTLPETCPEEGEF